MDGMLSQEEINALLSSMGSQAESTPVNVKPEETTTQHQDLTFEEVDAIGEISNICMGTAATTLFTLVNQKVVITTPKVSYATWNDIVANYDRPCVFIQIYYKDGLDGNNVLILKQSDAKVITDLMMGGDGSKKEGELTEIDLSAISEAMNQMMGSSSTSLSSLLDIRVDISPPSVHMVHMDSVLHEEDIAPFLKEKFVKVSFKMEIGDLVDSELMQLYPIEFAKELYSQFSDTTVEDKVTIEPQPQSVNPVMNTNYTTSNYTSNVQQQPMQGNYNIGGQMQPMQNGYNPYTMPPMQEVNVQPAQFQPFTNSIHPSVQQENIDLLLDVPLEVTVELGRTNKSIKEILDFSPGTIIELNRLAGEPIDVLVNGKFVAKGEVVVIEEVFGIRVTEIIK